MSRIHLIRRALLMGGTIPPPLANVFSADTYAGNGGTQTITNGINLSGLGGLVWIKNRTTAGYSNVLNDTVRGSGNYLVTNTTGAETADALQFTGFNSNGFGVGDFNSATSQNYVSWTFREAATFFDIVAYTGDGGATQTISHSLGVAPELIIVKGRSIGYSWSTYSPAGVDKKLNLSSTAATQVSWDFNKAAPTASNFVVSSTGETNDNTKTYIAYLFATLSGTSKVSTFTGNGTSQTINCGFSAGARFVMIKRYDNIGNWIIGDSTRGIVAGNDGYLLANTSGAEVTSEDWIDADNSGFVVNETTIAANTNNATYIYLAIA